MSYSIFESLTAVAALAAASVVVINPLESPYRITAAPTLSGAPNPIRTVVTVNSNRIDVLASNEEDVSKVLEKLRELCAGPHAKTYPEICEHLEAVAGQDLDPVLWWPSGEATPTIVATVSHGTSVSLGSKAPADIYISKTDGQVPKPTQSPVVSKTVGGVSLASNTLTQSSIISEVTVQQSIAPNSPVDVSMIPKNPAEVSIISKTIAPNPLNTASPQGNGLPEINHNGTRPSISSAKASSTSAGIGIRVSLMTARTFEIVVQEAKPTTKPITLSRNSIIPTINTAPWIVPSRHRSGIKRITRHTITIRTRPWPIPSQTLGSIQTSETLNRVLASQRKSDAKSIISTTLETMIKEPSPDNSVSITTKAETPPDCPFKDQKNEESGDDDDDDDDDDGVGLCTVITIWHLDPPPMPSLIETLLVSSKQLLVAPGTDSSLIAVLAPSITSIHYASADPSPTPAPIPAPSPSPSLTPGLSPSTLLHELSHEIVNTVLGDPSPDDSPDDYLDDGCTQTVPILKIFSNPHTSTVYTETITTTWFVKCECPYLTTSHFGGPGLAINPRHTIIATTPTKTTVVLCSPTEDPE